MTTTESLSPVTLQTRANVYFDGKCVSHSVMFADGTRKSVGIIFPSTLRFNTAAPEIMECVAGQCRYRMSEQDGWQVCAPGESFAVPEQSAFEIEVVDEPFHYICHFG